MSNTATRESRVNLPVYPGQPVMSSEAYLWVELRGEPSVPLAKVRIHSPKVCEHNHGICSECAAIWAQDYDIHYSRTKGGRKLRKVLS